jgi:hypothetical protein
VEFRAVAEVVFGDFFPEEGSEAGVFVLKELLATVAGDEVLANVGREVERWGHLFIDALEVELELRGVVDVGNEAKAGVAVDGALVPCAEGCGGAFGWNEQAAAAGADGVNALG